MITFPYLCKKELTMATTTTRVQTAFRLSPELLSKIRYAARRENLSVNSYVERVLTKSLGLEFPSRPTEYEVAEELILSQGCLQEPTLEELKNDPRLSHLLGYDQSAY